MKIMILAGLIVLFTAAAVFAHAPSAIRLTFISAGLLEVAVDHDSDDPGSHYIERIEVTVNGEKKEYYFKAQSDRRGLYQKLVLPVKSSDEISVTAFCNVLGASSVTLERAEPVRTSDIR